jgi:putative peptidoglycan lipid II flippase
LDSGQGWRWRDFADASPFRRFGRDAIVACVTSSIGKGAGFAKEVVVAAYFGLSASIDIYLVALVLIGFPLAILINAVQTALISAVAGEPDQRRRCATLTAATLFLGCVLLIILPFWLFLLPSLFPVVASGFGPEKQMALRAALYWLVPYYFLSAVNLLWYGFLQAKRRYWINGLLPVTTPLLTMIIVAVLGASQGWRTLVVALSVSSALESLMLVITLYPECSATWGLRDFSGLRVLAHHSLALLPGTAMIAVGPVVDQAIAASLGNGSNAALGYGLKLPAALLSVSATVIGMTALPYFSGQIAEGRYRYCLHSIVKLARWILLGGVLLLVPLALFSGDVVDLLYRRGAFDSAAVSRVAPIQLAYLAQIPFAMIAALGGRALSALGRNGLVSLYTITAIAAQIALAYALGVHIGAQGIALAAVCGSATLATLTFVKARRLFNRLAE